jgi:hypothetical protein
MLGGAPASNWIFFAANFARHFRVLLSSGIIRILRIVGD